MALLSCQVLCKDEFVRIISAINYTEYVTNLTTVALKIDIQAKEGRDIMCNAYSSVSDVDSILRRIVVC